MKHLDESFDHVITLQTRMESHLFTDEYIRMEDGTGRWVKQPTLMINLFTCQDSDLLYGYKPHAPQARQSK